MSGFSGEWLALREDADHLARNPLSARALNLYLRDQELSNGLVRVIDFGCGSGSNVRWLSPRLNANQHWQLFDNDAALLQQAHINLCAWAGISPPHREPAQFEQVQQLQLKRRLMAQLQTLDLNCQLPPTEGVHIVSASALIDLVSAAWLQDLMRQCQRTHSAIAFALNYDGRVHFHPHHQDDGMIRDAVNQHQLSDKGFGSALGPNCVAFFNEQCQQHGYRAQQWRSDWRLDSRLQPLQRQLIADFAHIARQVMPVHDHQRIEDWYQWRCQRVSQSHLTIGHVDVLATPRT